jgi:hypothetical protein
MLVEVTAQNGKRHLINSDKVIDVSELEKGCKIISVGPTFPLIVEESFEEVKKRLGLAIFPRAETLMKIA